MRSHKIKTMTRGALLIALALVLQALRLVLPLPQMASTFIIGTLVHMMLALTLWLNGRTTALLLSLLLPITAYMQGQLLLPFLVPVVWVGNTLFILLLGWLKTKRTLSLILVPFVKALVMAFGALLVLEFVHLPSTTTGQLVKHSVMFGMSVMQLVTGVAGLLVSRILWKHIFRTLK